MLPREDSKINISVIRSINKKINSTMLLPELLNSIMDAAKELLNAEGSAILLTDWATGDLIFHFATGEKGDILIGEKVPKGKGIAGTVAETGRPIIVNDAQNDPRLFKAIDEKSDYITRNILAIPMIMMDDMVGVLEIVNSKGREIFDEWDLQKAHYVADQAALAITNRRLLDESNKRIIELSTLYEVSQAISFAGRDDDILEKIIKSLASAMDVRKSSIILANKKQSELKLAASIGLAATVKPGLIVDMHDSISGLVLKNGYPMIVTDIHEIPEKIRSKGRNYYTDSFISIPIMYQNVILGILNITDKINGTNFDLDDLRLLTTISTQIAEAYINFQNQKNVELQRQLAEEIDIAAQIQKKILPNIPDSFKSHQLAAFNKPAKVVGGDFYDFFILDEDKYAVLIADISGKGIPAALFMGAARNIIRAQSRLNTAPALLLRNSNELIFQESEFGMFVTLFYAVIDSSNNLITYGSAGHNNQILVKNNSKKAIKLKSKGKALGMFDNIEFKERIVIYEPGDLLLLFTDGVVESLSEQDLDIDIGEKKLCQLAYQYRHEEPWDLINKIKMNFSRDDLEKEFRDDFTIFVIKF